MEAIARRLIRADPNSPGPLALLWGKFAPRSLRCCAVIEERREPE